VSAAAVQHGAVAARVQHQDHGLAQEGQVRAVAPFDARGLRAAGALGLLVQLAQDPALLLAQRRFDLAHAHPARCADAQALGADDEADAAAPGAPQLVVHMVLAEADLALGARVAEGRRHAGQRGTDRRRGGRCHHRCRHRCGGRGRRRAWPPRRSGIVAEQRELCGRCGGAGVRHGPRF
jgi:hypothetical protein